MALLEVLLALRSLSRPLSDMVLQTCSRASWLAVLLQAAQVLRRLPKSNKASLVCRVTCRLLARLASTHLRLLLTTHSHTVVSLKGPVSTVTVLSHHSLPLHQVQASRMWVPVAVSMADGPAAGLALTDGLLDVAALRRYHLLPAVRGDLLAKLGRPAQARAEFERAAVQTSNEAERAHLLARASVQAGSFPVASQPSAPSNSIH